MSEGPSALVKETARKILLRLREVPEGVSKDELVDTLGVSKPSIQRALTWLRDVCDSPVSFDRAAGRWRLSDPHFSLPLSDPQGEDLAAVMFAAAILAPLADSEITERVRRLAEQMDAEIRERTDAAPDAPGTRPGAIVASVSNASEVDPAVSGALLRAIGREVVDLRYASPWAPHGQEARAYRVEPWQLRMHDGAVYLRAYSLTHGEARSFAVAHVESVLPVEGLAPSAAMPAAREIWGDADPAFGIDYDRPETAKIRVRGGVARWIHRLRWHPAQVDRWIEAGELLEREVPYRSCRELARRLLSLGDALERVEPAELREAVRSHAKALAEIGD